jgi:hypothetical protein
VHAIACTFDPGQSLPLICVNLGGTSDVPREYFLGEGRERLIELTTHLQAQLAATSNRD